MTATLPTLTEAQFQAQITEYAELCGWEWLHVRAGRTEHGWRVPVSGTLAQGWPDLVLVRGSRLIFMEVKREAGKPSVAQDRLLSSALAFVGECYLVRPSDWDFIERELR